MSIQLSISLLASNRKESLIRCLDSLRPLLLHIPSELIVVLTEESEQICEIASLYTDQLISFIWCNDFSAARNVGLKAAKGEWFLYIDDDEWFEDVTEICDFFISGEYLKFNSAAYKVRNYLSWEGIRYLDIHVLRMARIVSGIHFQNPIHEDLRPAGEPRKYFDSYVHHYGYAVNNSKNISAKMSRNIPLLLQDVKNSPSTTKNYLQLVQEYTAVKNWKKAEEYCRKGLYICKKQQSAQAYYHWLQVHLITILYEKGDLLSAKQDALSILKTEKPCELVRLALYSNLIIIYSRQAEESIDILRLGLQFEQLLTYMDENPNLWEKQRYADLNEQMIHNPDKLLSARLLCVEAALKMHDYEKGMYFIELLPWEEEYQVLQYYPLFDEWKESYSPVFQDILTTLSHISPYLAFQKIMDIVENEKKETLLLQCSKDTKAVYLQMKIIEEAIQAEIGLSSIADTLDLDTWKQCTAELIKNIPVADMDKIEKSSKTLTGNLILHGLWLTKLKLEKELTHGNYMPSELTKLLAKYCNITVCFYKEQYQSKMFSARLENCLPQDYKFALQVSQAMTKIEKKEFLDTARILCSAVHYKPSMTGVVNEVIRLIKNTLSSPSHHVGEEYHSLAIQLKAALSTLIEQGMYAEATSILPQLVELLPEDLELLRIKQKLLRSME